MRILVTGTAGFIGFHLTKRFLERGDEVVGIDNLNDYYDVSLKKARLAQIESYENFTFLKVDIVDRQAMDKLFKDHDFDRVVHMAAQAGVRYSLENPHAYVRSNIVGFLNILEGCRHQWAELGTRNSESGKKYPGSESRISNPESRHLVFASSSSVYGLNTKMPFSVHDNVDHPISLYAATKKTDELMAHTYSYLYGIPATGLRFFTVYGPWGRPDMALFKFTKAILSGKTIDIYNEGKMKRDFTYIDDIVEGVTRITERIPAPLLYKPACRTGRQGQEEVDLGSSPTAPYKIYNIGNHSPVDLLDFIKTIEDALGKKAEMNFLPMQPGDVAETYADVDDLIHDVDFSPSTPIKEGIQQFMEWYRKYFSSR